MPHQVYLHAIFAVKYRHAVINKSWKPILLGDNVYQYIANQEEHHKKQTFRDEYLEFLKNFKVSYDERYIFEELI
jgi:hypothetical protein